MVPEVLTVLWVSSAQAQGTPQEGQPRGLRVVTGHVPEPQGRPQLSSQQKRPPAPPAHPAPPHTPGLSTCLPTPSGWAQKLRNIFLWHSPSLCHDSQLSRPPCVPRASPPPTPGLGGALGQPAGQPHGGVRIWVGGRSWGAFLSTCFWVMWGGLGVQFCFLGL